MSRGELQLFGIFFFMIVLILPLKSQVDSVVVTKNFSFEDGVYLQFEDFKNNQPNFLWEQLRTSLFTNPQSFQTQVVFIDVLENDSSRYSMNLDSIWGFTIDGIPYIRLPEETFESSIATYAGLQVRGKICYYKYQKYVMKELEMSAYNPLTGRPFRTANINREELVTYEKMLHFETGETADLTLENMVKWIPDDTNLIETINDIGTDDAQEKLFKILLIYDDRNHVKVPNRK